MSHRPVDESGPFHESRSSSGPGHTEDRDPADRTIPAGDSDEAGGAARGDESAAETPEDRKTSMGRQIAESYGASGTFRRDAHGRIDVLHAVGGLRGLVEATLPSLVFLLTFLVTEDLTLAIGISVGVAVVAAVARLAQRQNLMQAVSGAIGVVICALFARVGGNAIDYYVPGFWTNAAYLAAAVISMAVKWPFMGLIFGFIRGEDVAWRHRPERLRAYQLATTIFAGMLLARLVVQLPLYFAGLVGPLGAARLIMGMPFYALILWLAWMVSRPESKVDAGNPVDPAAADD